MKITASSLIRWGGLSAMVAGIFFVVVGLFHPPDVLSSVTTPRWVIVHSLASAMCFFWLLGITGLYARQVKETGWLGLAGYLLFRLWPVLTVPFTVAEVFILPPLVTDTPTVVENFLGIFNGSPGEMNLGAFGALYDLSGVLLILGGLHRDAARRHPVALGGRSACRRGRVDPCGCATPARAQVDSGGAGGDSSGLAGLCALV